MRPKRSAPRGVFTSAQACLARIESHGEAAHFVKASPQDLLDLLKAKAVEEAFELFWETSPERLRGG